VGFTTVVDFAAVDFATVVDFTAVDFATVVDFTGVRRAAPRDAWVAPRRFAAEEGFRVFFVLDL
jgi:hypothetical protein